MQQLDESIPSTEINLDGVSLKMEVIEQYSPVHDDNKETETTVAPPSVSSPNSLNPTISDPPTPTPTPIKVKTNLNSPRRTKKKLRLPLNTRKNRLVSSKPVTLIARPASTNLSTILPHPAKPVIVSTPITPIISNTVATVAAPVAQPLTTYLVVDGNQGQFVQVANDGKQPVTFRNQTGQILQATPINVVSATPNSTPNSVSSFPINNDCSLLSNSSQTVTTVRTSSSIDMQQKTMLTSDTTTTTTQQMTGILHQPTILPSNSIIATTIVNGNNTGKYNGTTLAVERSPETDLSLSQLAEKVNQRQRRFSSSSSSRKRRGRPRLYERDPFPNTTKTNDNTFGRTEITLPNIASAALIIPETSTKIHSSPPQNHAFNSISFPTIHTNQLSTMNSPILQPNPYIYPSLLNAKPSSTTLLNGTNMNIFQNPSNSIPTTYPLVTPSPLTNMSFSLSSTNSIAEPTSLSSLKNLQITSPQATNQSNGVVGLSTPNISPRTSSNPDAAIHYIGGYIIKESSQPFTNKDVEQKNKINSQNDQQQTYLQCSICRTVNLSSRFYDAARLACTKMCSITLYEKTLMNEKPLSISPQNCTTENLNLKQNSVSQIDEPINVSPNHGLPTDPSKWTVAQVGEFIGRLTNVTIRDAFFESEIDGQALLLMTPEHLRETLKIKLGPSLIIASEIAKLRDREKK